MRGDPDDALDLVGQAQCFGLDGGGRQHPRRGVFVAGGCQHARGGDALDDAPLRGGRLIVISDRLGQFDSLAGAAGGQQPAQPPSHQPGSLPVRPVA
ncbi:MAG: hypothetical protein ABSA53_23035 [Streptosporangiaceae bacterium]